jgi:hypothetical protein
MAPCEEEELTWFTREEQLSEMNSDDEAHTWQQRSVMGWR